MSSFNTSPEQPSAAAMVQQQSLSHAPDETAGDTASLRFHVTGLPPQTFRVRRVEGEEVLSQPFSFRVGLISSEPELDLEPLPGESARLILTGLHGERVVMGVIERFRQQVRGRRSSHYEAVLVSPLMLLQYTRRSRIFQQLSTIEIVEKVLASGPVSLPVRRVLMRQYAPRDFCVQYQESDLDFISRLLEEDGIFYFIDHTGEQPILILGDGVHAIDTLPYRSELPFRDESLATVQQEEAVRTLEAECNVFSGGTVLRDYRFKNPGVSLEQKRQEGRFTELERYYYPGGYVSAELGRELVRLRLEEQARDRSRIQGRSTIRGLMPGYRFTLSLHEREDFNREYLVCSVHHIAEESAAQLEEAGVGQTQGLAYQATFSGIPAHVPYRPSLKTPRPQIGGLQTATVVGPASEEIYCDEFGRVKVHFHWDRQGLSNEQDSCWIRVGQSWGGPGFGSVFVPRIGQEVMVQFLEGDPDRPLIVGVVYNGQNPVPYGLPDARTQSGIKSRTTPGGGGFNELRFEDSAGKEEVYLQAQLDMNTLVKRDHGQIYGRDRSTQIGRHNTIEVVATEKVKIGDTQQLTVMSDRTVKVGGDQQTLVQQNHMHSVMQNQVSTVAQDQVSTVGGTRTQTIRGTSTETFQRDVRQVVQGNQQGVVQGNLNQHTGGLARQSQKELMIQTQNNSMLTSGKAVVVKSATITLEANASEVASPEKKKGFGERLSDAIEKGVRAAGKQIETNLKKNLKQLGEGLLKGEGLPDLDELFADPFGKENTLGELLQDKVGGSLSSFLKEEFSAVVADQFEDEQDGNQAKKLLKLIGLGFAAEQKESTEEKKTTGGEILVKADQKFETRFGKELILKLEEAKKEKDEKEEKAAEGENKGTQGAETPQGAPSGAGAAAPGAAASQAGAPEKTQEEPKETILKMGKELFSLKVGDNELTLDQSGIRLISKKAIMILSDGDVLELAGKPIQLN